LNALEAQAVSANQELKAAVQQFEEARASLDITRAGLYPNLALTPAAIEERTSANRPAYGTGQTIRRPSTFADLTFPLDASYEVDFWGRVRRSVESARAQMQASSDDLSTMQLSICAEVAMDYFTLRALDAQAEVLRSSANVFRKSLALTKDRFAGGIASDLDVAEAETVLDTTEAQLPSVILQRAQLEHALALLTGQPAPSFHIAKAPFAGAPPVIPPSLPSELLERRPDIAAAERLMAAANANIGVARAAFFPDVELNGLAGFESLNVATLFNWQSRMWAVGPTVNLPIFEGGRLQAGLRLANSTYYEMVDDYSQTVLAAFSEVEDNLAAQALLSQQNELDNHALIAARKELRAANDRYGAGLITFLDVATAESTELTVEFDTVQVRGEQFVAAVSLIKSLGGGWQSATDPPERTRSAGAKNN
jgi:multidrug efflux system outer membrane protein